MELNETDLGLFHSRRTPGRDDNVLVENNPLDKFGIFDSAADLFNNTNVSQIDIGRSWGDQTTDGLDSNRSKG